MKIPACPPARRSRGAFALVITLLILSLLVIVSVSYLSSMTAERQTADAYDARAVAEQAAQTGVDNATALLAQCFRDFPDSATAWDPTQTENSGTPTNKAIVNSPNNEGTSLYLRAVPSALDAKIADPLPTGVVYTGGGTSYAANDANGNGPNNPACQTFVLPLISGVPQGKARLLTDFLAARSNLFPKMVLTENDPIKQNWTDLNIRRTSGDLQGVIGSPPEWTNTPGVTPVGPKPARAYWVYLNGSNNLPTARYAFWIEDESFRVNVNKAGNAASRFDNAANSRAAAPGDLVLAGAMAAFDTNTADADQIITTRDAYPGKFLPDPLALLHSTVNTSGASDFSTALADSLRYLGTTQSGSLNLTRHGTQRLNLNATTTIARDPANPANTLPVDFKEIRKMVEAIRFHLPKFGQRFYRSSNPDTITGNRSTVLNKADDVPDNTALPYAEMYLYKTAANLRDYIDTDDQPTMIVHASGSKIPSLAPKGAPIHPFGGDGQGGPGTNYMWAQGKDGAPFIQETMVRYRPAIQNSGENYTLSVDYYVEFWNMSDHDVSARSLGNHPFLRISTQQQWFSAYIDKDLKPGAPTRPKSTSTVPTPYLALTVADGGVSPGDAPSNRDFSLNLLDEVYRADNPTVAVPDGVVFKAGSATVITTDPDFVSTNPSSVPVVNSRFIYGGQQLTAAGFYAPNVYYCAQTIPKNDPHARRTFAGPTCPYDPLKLRGIMPDFRGPKSSTVYLDFEVEATLGNDLGYLDCAVGPFCISAGSGDGGSTSTNGFDFTWTEAGKEPHNDYLHGGSLAGNGTTPSQLGDPRTNNEQIYIQIFNGSSYPAQPDQSRYAAPGQNLAPPFTLGTPNSQYVKPASSTSGYTAWSDYYDWLNGSYPTATLNAASAPSVIANSALTSIGQLGDIFDPLRVIGNKGSATAANSRGGGRTLKIGQRDDRFTYDTSGNAAPNNTVNHVPASNGWAAWRLTDVFAIGDALELPGRINVNGVQRDKGASLRAALTGFKFQPQTTPSDYLVHGPSNLAGNDLVADPTNTNVGVSKLISQITNRLKQSPSAAFSTSTGAYSVPWGPFFERGELGELENDKSVNGTPVPLFGRNPANAFAEANKDLTGVDLNRTFDRGREELFRRLSELICTRGDTFTVYAVGQSILQPSATAAAKITGTQRMRVTFRLVPKYSAGNNVWEDFHPGYKVDPSNPTTITEPSDFNAEVNVTDKSADNGHGVQGINQRFAKPDRYEVQVLSANTY